MNKRINKRWQSLLLVTIAAVFLFGASSDAFGQKSQKKEVAPSSKPKPKKTSSNSALTQAVVEEIITGRQKKLYANLEPTVTFESVRIGKTRKANKADEYEGIPAGATVYPVRVKYSVVYRYSDGDKTENHHYDYLFFKDSFDEWATLGLGPVR